jgi:hypothetical protein
MNRSDFWNTLKQRVREATIAAADFTEEQAVIGKLKFDILTLKRGIERAQREIGARICELSAKSPPPNAFSDPEVRRHLKEISELEKQILQKRDDIGKVADQVRGRHGAAGAESGPTTRSEPKKRPPAKTAGGKKTTRRKSG